MNKENTKKLHEKYPTIFQNKDLPPTQSLMCFGFECDDGWYELIDEMCEELDAIEKMTGIQTIAQQCKEKFGGLRFYVNVLFPPNFENADVWDKIIYHVIGAAERNSEQTCEICGKYGQTVKKGGWYKTLCEAHIKELGYTS